MKSYDNLRGRKKRKNTTDRMVAVNDDKLIYKLDSVRASSTRIDHLGWDLLGKWITVTIPGGDYKEVKRRAKIDNIYPHQIVCVYTVHPEDREEKELKIGISTAELVQMGIISFKNGYAEVIK